MLQEIEAVWANWLVFEWWVFNSATQYDNL